MTKETICQADSSANSVSDKKAGHYGSDLKDTRNENELSYVFRMQKHKEFTTIQ